MKKAQGKFTATKTGPRIDRFPFEERTLKVNFYFPGIVLAAKKNDNKINKIMLLMFL